MLYSAAVSAAAVALYTRSKLSSAVVAAASDIVNLQLSQLKAKPLSPLLLLLWIHCGPLQQPTSLSPAFLYYCHSGVPMAVSD